MDGVLQTFRSWKQHNRDKKRETKRVAKLIFELNT